MRRWTSYIGHRTAKRSLHHVYNPQKTIRVHSRHSRLLLDAVVFLEPIRVIRVHSWLVSAESNNSKKFIRADSRNSRPVLDAVVSLEPIPVHSCHSWLNAVESINAQKTIRVIRGWF